MSNFKPGTLDAWGVGYGEASQRTPRIIYAMGSSFGPEGPDAQREGADLSGQAGGGIISTTGGAGSDPSPIGATIADHIWDRTFWPVSLRPSTRVTARVAGNSSRLRSSVDRSGLRPERSPST